MLGKFREVSVGRVLHNQGDVITCTIARNLRHLERQHPQILDLHTVVVETTDNKVNEVIHARTVVPVLQAHYHRSVVRTCTRQHTVATGCRETLQFRDLFYFLFNLLHHLTSLLKRCSLRSLYLGKEHALVLLWNET